MEGIAVDKEFLIYLGDVPAPVELEN